MSKNHPPSASSSHHANDDVHPSNASKPDPPTQRTLIINEHHTGQQFYEVTETATVKPPGSPPTQLIRGMEVGVLYDNPKLYFRGRVTDERVDPSNDKKTQHLIHYDDGGLVWENLDDTSFFYYDNENGNRCTVVDPSTETGRGNGPLLADIDFAGMDLGSDDTGGAGHKRVSATGDSSARTSTPFLSLLRKVATPLQNIARRPGSGAPPRNKKKTRHEKPPANVVSFTPHCPGYAVWLHGSIESGHFTGYWSDLCFESEVTDNRGNFRYTVTFDEKSGNYKAEGWFLDHNLGKVNETFCFGMEKNCEGSYNIDAGTAFENMNCIGEYCLYGLMEKDKK